MNTKIKTPQTDPDHHTVGHHYAGWNFERSRSEIYFCDSYDPRQGYWMTNVNDPCDRRNVSVRAIDRTFMEAEDQGASWWVRRWSTRITKVSLALAVPAATDGSSTSAANGSAQ